MLTSAASPSASPPDRLADPAPSQGEAWIRPRPRFSQSGASFFGLARSPAGSDRVFHALDTPAGRRSDLAKYTDITRPCLDIHEHGGRLDAVGRQRAISGIGLAINSVRRPIGSSVFGLTLESRLVSVSKTSVFETSTTTRS